MYDNTDQKEVTRLGMDWEWATEVTVTVCHPPRKVVCQKARKMLAQASAAQAKPG